MCHNSRVLMYQNDQEKEKGQHVNKGISDTCNFNKTAQMEGWLYTKAGQNVCTHTHTYQKNCRCGSSYIPLCDFHLVVFPLSPISCDKINESHLESCQQIKRITCNPTTPPQTSPPPERETPPPSPPHICNLCHPLPVTRPWPTSACGLKLLVYEALSY